MWNYASLLYSEHGIMCCINNTRNLSNVLAEYVSLCHCSGPQLVCLRHWWTQNSQRFVFILSLMYVIYFSATDHTYYHGNQSDGMFSWEGYVTWYKYGLIRKHLRDLCFLKEWNCIWAENIFRKAAKTGLMRNEENLFCRQRDNLMS